MPVSEYLAILVHFKKDQILQLEAHARARGCTRAAEIRRAIERHLAGLPPEKDIRIELAQLKAETARLNLATAQANAYAREQTRRAQTVRANMRQIMKTQELEAKIALAKIARGAAAPDAVKPPTPHEEPPKKEPPKTD